MLSQIVYLLQHSCTLLNQLKFSAMFLCHFVPSHPLTSVQNFTKIVSGEPIRRGLNARWVAKYSDVGPVEGYLGNDARYGLGYNY